MPISPRHKLGSLARLPSCKIWQCWQGYQLDPDLKLAMLHPYQSASRLELDRNITTYVIKGARLPSLCLGADGNLPGGLQGCQPVIVGNLANAVCTKLADVESSTGLLT